MREMREDRIVNGLNVGDLFKTLDAIKATPKLGDFKFRLKNEWIDGGLNRSTITTFYGTQQEINHKQKFVLDADEPPLLLGQDRGPNPVEYLLTAITSCVTSAMVVHAAAKGIQIDEVESSVEGDIDLRGFLGLDPNVRNGYKNIRIKFKIKADVFGHHGTLEEGTLNVGDTVQAQVNTAVRAATMRNHSVTHIMHKALREVLGDHVQQKGSLVNADRTRFDFAHNAPVTAAQIRDIEGRVNAEILANTATDARVMDIEAAQKTGAMMLFGEKYGETVRVLDIGSSRELCGGTHVQRTGDIGLFKVVGEGGVAAGVRRIEAVTGANALAYLQQLEDTVDQAAGVLKAPTAELNARIGQTLEHIKALEKEVAALKGKLASSQGDELVGQAVDVKGLKVLAAQLDGADAKTLRDTMDKLKDKLKTAAIVLAAVDGDKVQIAAGVTADSLGKVKAGELVNFVAQQVGGKGGGKPDMAMAGGTNAAALPAALASVQGWVIERLV